MNAERAASVGRLAERKDLERDRYHLTAIDHVTIANQGLFGKSLKVYAAVSSAESVKVAYLLNSWIVAWFDRAWFGK